MGRLDALIGRVLLDALSRGESCVDTAILAQPGRVLAARSPPPGTRLQGGRLCVDDPLVLALHLLRLGVSEKEAAKALDWRMFERYAAEALEEAGFRVWRDIRLHGPGGLQVDVLGLDGYGRGVVLECKHWSPRTSPPSRLRSAALRHLERARRLAANWQRLGLPRGRYRLVPALLVLREAGVPRLASGVPIVPVSRLRGFLEELDYLLEDPAVAVLETG